MELQFLPDSTQVADARDITDIKCTTLKDCHHVDLFSDARKVRAVGASPHFALSIRATCFIVSPCTFIHCLLFVPTNALSLTQH
jgi:hypothetical protein